MPENKTSSKENKEQKQVQQHDYAPFRSLTVDQIKKLDVVTIKLEHSDSKRFGESITLSIDFHPMLKKSIRSEKIFSLSKYRLLLLDRKDLKTEERLHVLRVPVRYFQRHDDKGELKYRRYEIMITRDVVVSDFFDFTDQAIIDKLGLELDFKTDKDSTAEFDIAQSEATYLHFT